MKTGCPPTNAVSQGYATAGCSGRIVFDMLKNHLRSCDVCGSAIPKGERYVVSKFTKHRLQVIEQLMPGIEPDMRPTMDVDSQGNVRLDIRIDCHMNMSVSGTETIN